MICAICNNRRKTLQQILRFLSLSYFITGPSYSFSSAHLVIDVVVSGKEAEKRQQNRIQHKVVITFNRENDR